MLLSNTDPAAPDLLPFVAVADETIAFSSSTAAPSSTMLRKMSMRQPGWVRLVVHSFVHLRFTFHGHCVTTPPNPRDSSREIHSSWGH